MRQGCVELWCAHDQASLTLERTQAPGGCDPGHGVAFAITNVGDGLMIDYLGDRRRFALALGNQQTASLLQVLGVESCDDATNRRRQACEGGKATGDFAEVDQCDGMDRVEMVPDLASVLSSARA